MKGRIRQGSRLHFQIRTTLQPRHHLVTTSTRAWPDLHYRQHRIFDSLYQVPIPGHVRPIMFVPAYLSKQSTCKRGNFTYISHVSERLSVSQHDAIPTYPLGPAPKMVANSSINTALLYRFFLLFSSDLVSQVIHTFPPDHFPPSIINTSHLPLDNIIHISLSTSKPHGL